MPDAKKINAGRLVARRLNEIVERDGQSAADVWAKARAANAGADDRAKLNKRSVKNSQAAASVWDRARAANSIDRLKAEGVANV